MDAKAAQRISRIANKYAKIAIQQVDQLADSIIDIKPGTYSKDAEFITDTAYWLERFYEETTGNSLLDLDEEE